MMTVDTICIRTNGILPVSLRSTSKSDSTTSERYGQCNKRETILFNRGSEVVGKETALTDLVSLRGDSLNNEKFADFYLPTPPHSL